MFYLAIDDVDFSVAVVVSVVEDDAIVDEVVVVAVADVDIVVVIDDDIDVVELKLK